MLLVHSKAKWLDEFKSLYKGADAQLVADEIMSIGDVATPQQIVDKARDEATELHKCFTWDDKVAAEKYRLHEARQITHHLVIQEPETPEGEAPKPPIRFFHQPTNGTGYRSTETIFRNVNQYQQLLETARAELRAFQNKYSRLTELDAVFAAIEKIA